MKKRGFKKSFGARGKKGPRDFGMKYKSDKPRFAKPAQGMRRPDIRGEMTPAVSRKLKAMKLVKALANKKDREDKKLFIVEGEKSFLEALDSSYQLHTVFATHAFLEEYPEIQESFKEKLLIVDEPELATLGTLAANRGVIGIFHMMGPTQFKISDGITIALSGVSDPGNLGTIIRIADWYGIRTIVASRDTVDCWNPKVVGATKGSFTRVQVVYRDLEGFFRDHQSIPVIAADMRGQNAHTMEFPKTGILLLGSESHGIDPDLDDYITTRITIPRYGGAESLNVAIAGAVILDNWFR